MSIATILYITLQLYTKRSQDENAIKSLFFFNICRQSASLSHTDIYLGITLREKVLKTLPENTGCHSKQLCPFGVRFLRGIWEMINKRIQFQQTDGLFCLPCHRVTRVDLKPREPPNWQGQVNQPDVIPAWLSSLELYFYSSRFRQHVKRVLLAVTQ